MNLEVKEKRLTVIDIEEVIKKKSAKLHKRLPKFVFSFLKNVIKQDRINEVLLNNQDLEGVEFAASVLSDLRVKYKPHNLSNLDPNRKYVFVSNHPLGGIDGLVLISLIGGYYKKVKFVVNDLLMNLEPLKPVFFPVNKFGKMNQDNINQINKIWASDSQILYFPAGLCSRRKKGVIRDIEWRKSFLTKALEYKRDIVPIYFEGRNSNTFYTLSNIRTFLKIKFNIEMITLVREMFNQENNTYNVYIGKPIPIETITNDISRNEWVKIIQQKCYETNPTT